MALTTMMMIKKDKEAVDKEMTQGATAHLVSLPLLPIGHTLPPDRIQDISTLHQLNRIQDIIHFYCTDIIQFYSTPTHCP